jgi:hypothetical protein
MPLAWVFIFTAPRVGFISIAPRVGLISTDCPSRGITSTAPRVGFCFLLPFKWVCL